MRQTHLLIAAFLCLLLLGSQVLGSQAHSEEVDGARAWLDEKQRHEKTIADIEARSGPFAAALYKPLMQVARLQLSYGAYVEATDTLRRAQNITHRNEGVYTPSQLQAVALLTEIALTQKDWQAANQQQKFIFFTRQRHLGKQEPQLIGAYFDLADWYLRTGQPRRAKRLMEEAAPLATNAEQRFAIASLEEKSQRLQGSCCKTKRLEEAVANSGGKNADHGALDALANLHLTLADSLILSHKPGEAQKHYAEAAAINPIAANGEAKPISVKKLLRSQTSGLVRRYRVRPMPFLGTRLERMSPTEQIEDDAQPPQWFIFDGDVRHLGFKARDLRTTPLTERSTQALTGHPMIFSEGQLSHLLPGSLSGPEARAHLLIELVFSVAANGDLENISVAESNAPNKLDRMLVSALKKMRYRPRLVNGVPVRQDGVRIVQTFAETDTSL